MSDSLWPHGLQHTRLPCSSPIPRACLNSCPSSRWCHPTISSSVCRPFLLLTSIFPSIRVFSNKLGLHIRWPSIGVSASASVLPMNIQGWFPLGLTGLIFLQFKGLSRVFSNTTVQKHQFFSAQLSLWSNSHIHTLHWKNYSFDYRTFVGKVTSLLLNMLSRFVMGFPGGSTGKKSTCNVGDLGLTPGLRRSPGEGKGYPLQYSDLENSMDCMVHGVSKSRTQLSDFHFTSLHFTSLLGLS